MRYREVTERELFSENYFTPTDILLTNGGITVDMINQVRNSLLPGQIVKVSKKQCGVAYDGCIARVVKIHPNIASFEDVEEPGRIFTVPYKDLVGRIQQ